MAAKKKPKPYVAPTFRPISKGEAERIAGGPDALETLGQPHVNPPSMPVGTVKLTVVSVEGSDVDAATMGTIGELVGKLLR